MKRTKKQRKDRVRNTDEQSYDLVGVLLLIDSNTHTQNAHLNWLHN